MRVGSWIGGLALVGAAACGGTEGEVRENSVSSPDPQVTPADTVQPVPRSDDQGMIGKRLYDEKLQAIPEVQRAMNRHIRMYQEGRVPRDVAMARFRAWLELWVSEHPNAGALAAEASKLPEFVTRDTAGRSRKPTTPAAVPVR